MEDTLRAIKREVEQIIARVLILVLMEDTLRALDLILSQIKEMS